ncbi:hypothetical protein IU459_04795 [Nocardia amamiensis]|uniref:Uncharacterized protein n=1 Tax=Nocardia amamiensis TaxID=404578 RepID=A0ABS0CKV8_9NOCA|nr:hypothetical protein [Nocardia amamiensis]MBF6296861.1 hypothetical protein [Nocardia amamiensis]
MVADHFGHRSAAQGPQCGIWSVAHQIHLIVASAALQPVAAATRMIAAATSTVIAIERAEPASRVAASTHREPMSVAAIQEPRVHSNRPSQSPSAAFEYQVSGYDDRLFALVCADRPLVVVTS